MHFTWSKWVNTVSVCLLTSDELSFRHTAIFGTYRSTRLVNLKKKYNFQNLDDENGSAVASEMRTLHLLTVDYKRKQLLIICWKQGRKGFLRNKCKCQKIFYHTNNATTMLMYLTHKSHITTVTLFLMAGSSEVSNSLARVAMHCLAKSSFWRHNFPDKDKNSFAMIHWF